MGAGGVWEGRQPGILACSVRPGLGGLVQAVSKEESQQVSRDLYNVLIALTEAEASVSGENDRAYLYLFNTAQSASRYVKVGLRAAWDTDSASGDWFAVLPPFGQLFIPISDMQSVDLEANSGSPIVEYMLFQKDTD